jgi:excisionase family DNA binding protein
VEDAGGSLRRIDSLRGMSSSRFLTLDQVAEEMSTTKAQVYALVRRGDLGAIKLGGRGQWRVGRQDLETYIGRLYEQTAQWIGTHPYIEGPKTGTETGAEAETWTDSDRTD